VQQQDLEMILSWRNHPEVRRYMFTQHEIGLDEHLGWFERSSRDERRRLMIFEADGVACAFVNLTRVGKGEVWDWGFYVAPGSPRGTGRRLGRASLHEAFFRMKVHKLCGQVLAGNERSVRFHEALGFVREGELREQQLDGQEYRNLICFGLLRSEYLAREDVP